jgi:hypothetical protein
MKSICYALCSVSPQAYRFARQLLPLPSATIDFEGNAYYSEVAQTSALFVLL